MTDTTNYLETFPAWLGTLGADAASLATVLGSSEIPSGSREAVAGGLNYLFKSLDLIPDGIADIGFLDDAFVLRVTADLAVRDSLEGVDDATQDAVHRLAGECETIRGFLAQDYERLETYVRGLRTASARGRTVGEILENADVRSEFVSEVQGFSENYEAPTFSREERNLVKLKAFFDAKLPRKRESLAP
jgi:uncharacterized membrane protein YkvA (DUF1232 family)